MNKHVRCFIAVAVAAGALLSFAGCGSSNTITTTPNVGVEQGAAESVGKYDTVAYFEQEKGDDVKIRFEADKIQKVSFMYRVLDKGDYSFRNDVLTVKKKVFENETAGEKRLRVFAGGKYVEIALRIVTKVLYTTEDFNTIRTNLNGVYVLGNDIDFGNEAFWPIGKPVKEGESTGIFEGIFDGMGYAVKNITIDAYDYAGGNGEYQTGPNTGAQISNSRNYNAGIFTQTSANSQIINTNFTNITVNCQGLGGAVVGANGGLIKNCRVSCTLYSHGECEKAAGIAGMNGSGDAAGKIENCIVTYTYGSGIPRGIADWNVGSIRNCYAAGTDNFVYYPDYDYETGKRDPEFDYNTYLNDANWTEWIYTNYSLPAFPGTVDTSQWKYYPGGTIVKSEVVQKEFLLDPANFSEEDGWDKNVWHFEYGMYPTLRIQSR